MAVDAAEQFFDLPLRYILIASKPILGNSRLCETIDQTLPTMFSPLLPIIDQ